jgi:YbbR domain-containing protein
MNQSRIKNWFVRNNIGYKLLAVLLALMLWYYVTDQRDPIINRSFQCPVEPRGLASEQVLVSSFPDVSVTVKGSKSLMQKISKDEIRVFVNIPQQDVGDLILPVEVEVPLGIQVISTDPERIRVNLDYYSEKSVPVKVMVQGELDAGFTFKPPVVTPDKVTVRGPSRLLAKVSQVSGVLKLNGGRSDIQQKVLVKAPKDVGSNVEIRPNFVQVQLSVVPSGAVKTVAVFPVLQGKPKSGFTIKEIRVEPDQIQVTGSPELLSALREINTVPIDITDLEESATREVDLVFPDGVVSLEQEKVHVKITIDVIASEEEQLPDE